MQDVNNDMDDLFRKAAELYPLQTEGADWEKVLSGLQENDAPMPVATGNRQKRKKRALWLLWLLPLCLLYMPLHDNYLAAHQSDIAKTSSQNKKTVAAKSAIQNIIPPVNNAVNSNSNAAAQNKINTALANNRRQAQSFDAQGNRMLTGTDAFLVKNGSISRQNAAINAMNKNKNPAANTTDKSKAENNEVLNKNNNLSKQPAPSSARIDTVTTTNHLTKMEGQKEAIAKDTATVKNGDSAVTKNNTKDDTKKGTASAQTQQQKGFYGGLAGSFDLSTVKLQRINKTGYGLQMIAGYRFSKHLSVETGLGWELKNYYSTGKYFDKKKAKIPDAVEIYFSNGNCKMLEIPLTVKYDFAVHKKSNLFVTAGVSSYFMKKESYFYHGNYRSNNMNWIYDTTRYYRNSGSNLLSVAGFSIGYQAQINKHSTLRIEPYIKLPLHGIGIANMPITSTGISVGFTRKF